MSQPALGFFAPKPIIGKGIGKISLYVLFDRLVRAARCDLCTALPTVCQFIHLPTPGLVLCAATQQDSALLALTAKILCLCIGL
jgi:hypothetical protein